MGDSGYNDKHNTYFTRKRMGQMRKQKPLIIYRCNDGSLFSTSLPLPDFECATLSEFAPCLASSKYEGMMFILQSGTYVYKDETLIPCSEQFNSKRYPATHCRPSDNWNEEEKLCWQAQAFAPFFDYLLTLTKSADMLYDILTSWTFIGHDNEENFLYQHNATTRLITFNPWGALINGFLPIYGRV
jgi:hypothetical protein